MASDRRLSSSSSVASDSRRSSKVTATERKTSNNVDTKRRESVEKKTKVEEEKISTNLDAEEAKILVEQIQELSKKLNEEAVDVEECVIGGESHGQDDNINSQEQKVFECGDNTDIHDQSTVDKEEAKTEEKNETSPDQNDENTMAKPEVSEVGEMRMYSTRTTIEIVPKQTVTEEMVATIKTEVSEASFTTTSDETIEVGATSHKVSFQDDLSEDSLSRKSSMQDDSESGSTTSKKNSVAEAISEDVSMKSLVTDDTGVNNQNNQDQLSVKVTAENNPTVDDNDDVLDDDDSMDNDSVEGDDIRNLPTMQFGANKTRKLSEATSSERRFSQKFVNPFEPPCPELVDKTALIAEFNNVQEQNLKNNFKTESSQESQYFTSQALNNATSTSINHVSRSISVSGVFGTKSFIIHFWQIIMHLSILIPFTNHPSRIADDWNTGWIPINYDFVNEFL